MQPSVQHHSVNQRENCLTRKCNVHRIIIAHFFLISLRGGGAKGLPLKCYVTVDSHRCCYKGTWVYCKLACCCVCTYIRVTVAQYKSTHWLLNRTAEIGHRYTAVIISITNNQLVIKMAFMKSALLVCITAVAVLYLPNLWTKPLPLLISGTTAPGFEQVLQLYR